MKDRQHNGQRTTGQTTIYKTLQRKLKTELHELHKRPGVNSSAPEEYAVPAPLVVPVMVLS